MMLMKQLDEDGSGYRALIERELSARLAAKLATGTKPATPPTTPPPPAAVEAATAGLCTCGTANDPDAVFCKRCGTKLVA